VILRRPAFAEVLDTAIAQPRRYGSSDPQVMGRLFLALEEISWHSRDATPVREQLARLRATVARSDFDDTEIAQLESAAARVTHAMAQRAAH
jgi:uncharacterized membrane protein